MDGIRQSARHSDFGLVGRPRFVDVGGSIKGNFFKLEDFGGEILSTSSLGTGYVLDIDIMKEAMKGHPFAPKTFERVTAALPNVSSRRACRTLQVPRSSLRCPVESSAAAPANPSLVELIHQLVRKFPTFGYRRIRAPLKRRHKLRVNRKAVQRIFQLRGWQVTQRQVTPRPRVQANRSQTPASDVRWAVDVSHINRGQDGWGATWSQSSIASTVKWSATSLPSAGVAHEAERALESAWLNRFGTLRNADHSVMLRSDNGLIFQSRLFRAACKAYGGSQEFITPYTPEQNGIVERFFRSLKEGLVSKSSRPSPKRELRFALGSSSTITTDRIRRLITGLPSSAARPANNSSWRLDFRGSLQG